MANEANSTAEIQRSSNAIKNVSSTPQADDRSDFKSEESQAVTDMTDDKEKNEQSLKKSVSDRSERPAIKIVLTRLIQSEIDRYTKKKSDKNYQQPKSPATKITMQLRKRQKRN